MFPPEVVEKILRYCDGKTIKSAEEVNCMWSGCVDYLSKETDIWRRCCYSDIPRQELLQILNKYDKRLKGPDVWRRIFNNWYYWHNIGENIDFEVNSFCFMRCVCLNVFGEYIALGFDNGFVCIYKADKMHECYKSFRLLHLPVSSTALIGEDDSPEPSQLLINYTTSLFVTDFNRKAYQPGIMENSYKFGHCKRYVCTVTPYGRVTIATVKTDHVQERLSFYLLAQVRIYSPAIVTDCYLLENLCTILVNNKVKIIKYSDNSLQSSMIAQDQTTLQFSSMELLSWQRLKCTTRFISSQVVINLTKDANSFSEMFELYIIDPTDKYKKKVFNSWETFHDSISCMYLYGNTFLVGMNCGDLYFYEISDWKLFNLAKYSHVEHVARMCPILAIDVCDSLDRRTFYCVTSGGIYRVVCYCIPLIKETTVW